MKRSILYASSFILASSLLIVSGCSKEEDSDTTSPVVTLNGAASDEVSLGSSYSDPGATATDDVDGSVTVTSDYSSTSNPNVNRVNSYTITYTATDAAGNVGTATRTVRVKNDAEGYIGTYTVTDTCDGFALTPFTQNIYIDSITNNRIHFSKFANYANNTGIYGTVYSADNHFEIPFQAANSIGTGAGACDVVDHTFVSQAPGSITIVNGSVFKISYTDAITTAGCTGSTLCVSYFVKQ